MKENLTDIDKIFLSGLQDHSIDDSKLSWVKFSKLYFQSNFWSFGMKSFNAIYAAAILGSFAFSGATYMNSSSPKENIIVIVHDTIYVEKSTEEKPGIIEPASVLENQKMIVKEDTKSLKAEIKINKDINKIKVESLPTVTKLAEPLDNKVLDLKVVEENKPAPEIKTVTIAKKVPVTIVKRDTVVKFDTLKHKRSNKF